MQIKIGLPLFHGRWPFIYNERIVWIELACPKPSLGDCFLIGWRLVNTYGEMRFTTGQSSYSPLCYFEMFSWFFALTIGLTWNVVHHLQALNQSITINQQKARDRMLQVGLRVQPVSSVSSIYSLIIRLRISVNGCHTAIIIVSWVDNHRCSFLLNSWDRISLLNLYSDIAECLITWKSNLASAWKAYQVLQNFTDHCRLAA